MLKKFIEFTKLIVNTTEFMEKSRKKQKGFYTKIERFLLQ